jgi:hypothetical protein
LTLLAAGLLPVLASAQAERFRPAPKYVSGSKADQEEGRKALAEFRALDIAGTYWLEFNLEVMPRKGAERTVRGQLFGTRNEQGPLSRLTIDQQSWLIQSGPQPAAWIAGDATAARALTAAESLQPVAGTDLTIFDLQMPFLYWNDFIYEGIAKIRGRPAYSFVLYPPADFAAQRHELTGVRVALDTQFHALVQAEQLGPEGEATKAITVLDLKKVGEQWLVKSIDFRNTVTRDKTRFNATAAALDVHLPGNFFAPRHSPPRPNFPPARK